MTDQDLPITLPAEDPQRTYLEELYAETAGLPEGERAEQKRLIAELAGDIGVAEAVQDQASKDIESARAMARSSCGKAETTSEATFPLDFSQIGWLGEEETEPLPVERIEAPGLNYYFGSIIDRDNVTSEALEHLDREGIADDLLSKVKTVHLPRLWSDITSGGGSVRPISIKNNGKINQYRSLNTTYPAYKIDVQGTNNRAIVIVAGKIDGDPVLILATLYDHEDMRKIMRHMFLKYKP